MRLFLASFLLIATLTGCGVFGSEDGSEDSSPAVEGPYEIKITATLEDWDEPGEFTYQLDISESNDSLSGSGTLLLEDPSSSSASTYDLSISGSHTHPDLRFEMESTEVAFKDVFEGTSEDGVDRIEGTLTFADGGQQSVVMRSR